MVAIAPAKVSAQVSADPLEMFARMLPTIREVASYGFRRVPRKRREELVGDVVAHAYVAFVALAARGKTALAYPSVLAKFAIRQIRSGRQLGCPQNSKDPLSPLAQRLRGFHVQSLEHQTATGQWADLVEDRRATPAEIATCRIDFGNWLGQLGSFQRKLALRLAAGDTPGEAARHFRLSAGRISQLRKELDQDWEKFQAVPLAE